MKSEIIIYSAYEDMTYSELKNIDINNYPFSDELLQQTEEIFEKNNIKAFIMGDENYHTKFHSIVPVPYVVHYIGDISLLDKKILGIVGPRKPSQYSFNVLQNMFECAQNYDFVTVSGMAEGVDQLSHSFSVKYHIPTIAILGGGLYHFLKGPNRYIIDTIVQNGGLVLSEYKIKFRPTKYSFPQRNRIISGLSDILFLPEAGEHSGSLITAEFAYQQNKPIFVTPNSIFSTTSYGIHQLISQQKANIVVDFNQFFFDNFKKVGNSNENLVLALSEDEEKILKVLHKKGTLDLANLIVETHIGADDLINYLTMLEINNYICQNSPGLYDAIR